MEQRSRAGRGQSARPPIRAPEGFLEEEGAVSGPGLVSRLSPRPSLATADAIEKEHGCPGKTLWRGTLTGRRGKPDPCPSPLLPLPTSRPPAGFRAQSNIAFAWKEERERVPDFLQHISLQMNLP